MCAVCIAETNRVHNKEEHMKLENTSELHDYTELVIEISNEYLSHGMNLSNIGGGNSREGIDKIMQEALYFFYLVEKAEERGWWWDGGWIEAVQCYASCVVNDTPFDIYEFMKPKETKQ
jgi:hypothetical protein